MLVAVNTRILLQTEICCFNKIGSVDSVMRGGRKHCSSILVHLQRVEEILLTAF
jgi:hypothetical protein